MKLQELAAAIVASVREDESANVPPTPGVLAMLEPFARLARLERFARQCATLDSDDEGGEFGLATCIDDTATDARRALGLCMFCGLRDATPDSADDLCAECYADQQANATKGDAPR